MIIWLYDKGLAGLIARDLCNKYIAIKGKYSSESEEKVVERVWNFWLTLNEEPIRQEDGLDKNVRLDLMKEEFGYDVKRQKYKNKHKSLMMLYKTIIYIETEVSITDGKLHDKALQVFVKNAKKAGLDYEDEFEQLKFISSKLIK